jgi:hypothetical protein
VISDGLGEEEWGKGEIGLERGLSREAFTWKLFGYFKRTIIDGAHK